MYSITILEVSYINIMDGTCSTASLILDFQLRVTRSHSLQMQT